MQFFNCKLRKFPEMQFSVFFNNLKLHPEITPAWKRSRRFFEVHRLDLNRLNYKSQRKMYGITHESQLTFSFHPFFHLVHNVIVNLTRFTFKRIHKTILCSFPNTKCSLSVLLRTTLSGVPVCTESFKCMKPFWVLFKFLSHTRSEISIKKHQLNFF